MAVMPFISAVRSRPGILYLTNRGNMMAAPSTAGGGRPTSGRPKSCDSWSPHEPGMSARGIKGKPVPVRCNRPSGHSGNHMCLAGNFDRLAEWEQAKVVI